MRKCALLILLIFMTTLVYPGSKDGMNSFMGFKWGVSATKFLEQCTYKDRLEEVYDGFRLKGQQFGDAVAAVHFVFRDPDDDRFFFEESFSKFQLWGVVLEFDPKYYGELLTFLKISYGAPDEELTFGLAQWRNETQNRKILLLKKGTHGNGRAEFMPIIDKTSSIGKKVAVHLLTLSIR